MTLTEIAEAVEQIEYAGKKLRECYFEWDQLSLEEKVGKAACVIGGPSRTPRSEYVVTYAYGRLCKGEPMVTSPISGDGI